MRIISSREIDFLAKPVHKGIHNIVANYPDVDEKETNAH